MERVRFWTDLWPGSTPLQKRFMRLFALERVKNCLVKNKVIMITSGNIKSLKRRRSPREGSEEEELVNLCSELENLINQTNFNGC